MLPVSACTTLSLLPGPLTQAALTESPAPAAHTCRGHFVLREGRLAALSFYLSNQVIDAETCEDQDCRQ